MIPISFLLPALLFSALGTPVADVPLPFPGKWQLKGEATIEKVEGKDTLQLGTGNAHLRDVQLQDGTIDLDLQATHRRSFVYVMFRMANDLEYEEIYFRPHKPEAPDTIQYAPVYQGHSAWQLHHGPGATAPLRLEPGVWTHVRIILQGRRLALYVGDMAKPALLVPRLARKPRPGYLALRAFLPPDQPKGAPIARYANVVVRPGHVPVDLAALQAAPLTVEANAVRAWAISNALAPLPGDNVPTSPDPSAMGLLRRVEAEADGMVELHRHVDLPKGSRELNAAARIRVHADQAGLRAFDLGFSDRATVFVNGTPLFRGEASYSYAGRREGLIGYEQARLYLPFRAGENEVLVLLSDNFGGMGLMGRFPDPTGLAIDAR